MDYIHLEKDLSVTGMNGGPQLFLRVNPSANMDTIYSEVQDINTKLRLYFTWSPPKQPPSLSTSTSCIIWMGTEGAIRRHGLVSRHPGSSSSSSSSGRAFNPPLIPTISPHANWCGWRRKHGGLAALVPRLVRLVGDNSRRLSRTGHSRRTAPDNPPSPRPEMGQ